MIAITSAITGHQKGTKLVTPGINNRSFAGIGSSGGEVALSMALKIKRSITPNITIKHNHIENSPNPLQNRLYFEILSKKILPFLVLIISMKPNTLVASQLSKVPLFSRVINPQYQITINMAPQIGSPRR